MIYPISPHTAYLKCWTTSLIFSLRTRLVGSHSPTFITMFHLLVHFSGALKKLISETMVHWAQETEMQDPELVRAVFSLLHRQYQGLGGQMAGPLCSAYTISQASVEDTMALLSSLSQIRSLLSVRMGKEEERLMIRQLG